MLQLLTQALQQLHPRLLLMLVDCGVHVPDSQHAVRRLRVNFSGDYPLAPPEIYFEASQDYQPPVHNHIYSNGMQLSIHTQFIDS
jgi:ubiquitin-protein ligase